MKTNFKTFIKIFLLSICLVSCSTNDIDNREFYIVENFEIGGKIDAVMENYPPRHSVLQVYEMDLIKDGDTIHKTYATQDELLRFFKGDTIYCWYGRWIPKH